MRSLAVAAAKWTLTPVRPVDPFDTIVDSDWVERYLAKIARDEEHEPADPKPWPKP